MMRREVLIGGTLILICLICAVGVLSVATRLTPSVRNRAVKALNEWFDGETELTSLQVSIFPRLAVWGQGLTLSHKGRRDLPPLISIDSFQGGAGALGVIGRPLRLRTIELNGLAIHVPPGGRRGGAGKDRGGAGKDNDAPSSPLVIDKLVARAVHLEIAPGGPEKLPRVFEIHHLDMSELGLDRAALFRASLTNPKPEGQIDARGAFGPWEQQEPRLTPLHGEYVFRDAHLDTIKGTGGVLSSTGHFGGVLQRIEVEGETDTPDFVVDIAGQPLPLKTRFKAVVDGTSGNTWLDSVQATLLHSVIIAHGGVVRSTHNNGRTVSLDIIMKNARLEDLLTLAVKSAKPPLTGRIEATAKLLLPPGEQDVVQKLQLDGQFNLREARFTNFDVQKQISTLSHRGRGDTEESPGESVVSNLNGRFVLKNAVLSFSELTFSVPGATVQVAGSYALRSGQIDFTGNLLLEAKLSDTTTGLKAALARMAGPLFRREGGGTKLPIKISGTRSKPSFGLDVKRALIPGR